MASSKLEFPVVPPPSPDLSLTEIFVKSSGDTHANAPHGSHFSPAYLAVLGILGAAIVLVIYYYCFVFHFNCFSGEQRRRQRQINIGGAGRDSELGGVSTLSPLHMIKKGLDEETIRSIPTCTYYPSQQHHDSNQKITPYDPTSNGADESSDGEKNKVHNNSVMCSDCAVCLGSFREAEVLRQLPSCRHAFHMACVDRWLSSCSECPLCRTDVVAPPLSVPSPRLDVLVGGVQDLAPQLASHVTLPRFGPRQQVDLPSTHPTQFQDGREMPRSRGQQH